MASPLNVESLLTAGDSESEARLLSSIAQFQAFTAGVEFLAGDFTGGIVQGLVALLGLHCASTKKNLAVFATASFTNGTIQVVTLADVLPRYQGALLSLHFPLLVNMAHICIVTTPVVSYAAMLFAYRLIQAQRAERIQQGDGAEEADTSAPIVQPPPNRPPEFAPFVGVSHQLETPRETPRPSVAEIDPP